MRPALLAALLLTACGPLPKAPRALDSFANGTVRLELLQDGPLRVTLDPSGTRSDCPAIDPSVTATLDGVKLDLESAGGNAGSCNLSGACPCKLPTFTLPRAKFPPDELNGLRLEENGKSFVVTVEGLLREPEVTLRTRTPGQVAEGEAVEVAAGHPGEALSFASVAYTADGATDAAFEVSSTGQSCNSQPQGTCDRSRIDLTVPSASQGRGQLSVVATASPLVVLCQGVAHCETLSEATQLQLPIEMVAAP